MWVGPGRLFLRLINRIANSTVFITSVRWRRAEIWDGAVSAFDYMPIIVVDAIRAGTNTTDVTSFVNAALATGRNVFAPAGRYPLSGQLNYARNGQELFGESPYQGDDAAGLFGTVFVISAAKGTSFGFDSYVKLRTRCRLDKVAFEFAQTAAAASGLRSDLVVYPWAIDVSTAPGFYLGRVGLFRSYNGVKALGNCGGGLVHHVIDGSFNIGLDMDGPLHAVNVRFWDTWLYGSSPSTNLTAIFSDGNTITCRFGRCDELMVDSIAGFRCRVVYNGQDRGIPALFGKVGADDSNARWEHNSGRAEIATFYGTTNSASDAKIRVSGGSVMFGAATVDSNASAHTGLIVVTGGRCVVNSGESYSDRLSIAATVSGGTLEVHNFQFAGNDTTNSITQPKVLQSGTGRLIMTGCQPADKGSSATGTFVKITTDGQHIVAANSFLSWALELPANASLGTYGPNIGITSPTQATTGIVAVRKLYRRYVTLMNSAGNTEYNHGISGLASARNAWVKTRIRAADNTGNSVVMDQFVSFDDTKISILTNNTAYGQWNCFVEIEYDA
ncbi:hypothetical protein MMB17_12730 [Methylobacterium organophilum]|uniref:hypothetical protein n=1 Tax=Methylobacterium organophilum TaxID=410 RepID=UPI001F12D01A|nr:hypothetical protein [Methylobacterium organophilum]UMY15621.1 hypothetical protein MMB17_12730 [Methylobacterium organophilum]